MRIKTFLLGLIAVSVTVFSSIGAARMDSSDSFTIKEALTYSMEDELLARAEYEKIIENYGKVKPFINIIEAEKKHIKYLEPLLEKYGVEYPVIPDDAVVLPGTLEEAYRIGVEVEIANIAMYEKFLQNKLPDDVRGVFIKLKNASKNHLIAFERQLIKRK